MVWEYGIPDSLWQKIVLRLQAHRRVPHCTEGEHAVGEIGLVSRWQWEHQSNGQDVSFALSESVYRDSWWPFGYWSTRLFRFSYSAPSFQLLPHLSCLHFAVNFVFSCSTHLRAHLKSAVSVVLWRSCLNALASLQEGNSHRLVHSLHFQPPQQGQGEVIKCLKCRVTRICETEDLETEDHLRTT